ncbi:nitrite reductase large subunit NirB [Paenibacillus sp. CF384]|uniref:nitrite reductase large subunit NirB n=1 Tax=Paenibacillus sp. CF384 TaxID=1884382 RepID=UPI00089C32DE|nr:nitrite reductase large subunit NirB [Paenibacillus sp. CF384]SDW76577.1 nitrite reductase (NADH) large subunit [Paenibacillus sp. CF384]
MKKKLVLVGNGMAGVNCIEQLLKLAPNLYDITIIGSEPHPNYNRILLSSVLAGDADMKDIVINEWSWYEENHITLHTGRTVTSIDSERKQIGIDNGLKLPYDELIIATGSSAFILPVPGADKPGVIAFRDIKDCETMMETAKTYRKAVVIGGGLLGLEAARGLLNLNMEVTVVHKHPYIMERQLDQTASTMLRSELEQQGMKFLLSKNTERIYGKKRVSGLRFTDGTEEETDLIVMAVGIRPNVDLARQAGITINQGIVVNDFLETSLPNVYAVGECVEHRGVGYGLVAPLYEQGAVIAKQLAGLETDGYHGSVVSTKLKVSGVDVFSAGVYNDRPGTRSVRVQDDFGGVYKKVLISEGKVIGAVLFGDISDSSSLFKMIRTGEDVTGREKEVLLGASGGGAQKSGAALVAGMPDDEIVCGCNGVSKGAIVNAVNEKGCSSINEIKACTKAGGSCGGCKPLVGDVLTYVLGADGVKTVKEGICGCTTLGRDEVVEAIKNMHLTTSKEVMNVLDWSNTEGCSKCRPALNYYLGMLWPDEHEDERESRFVNERNHANIQKDGTYSVVPRMYGGVTTPEDLQKIANVALKYEVPLVKMTGGQRIDLLGVKKEDLPKMWADLDMPSGYAYGKTLRTVKTCVGETFCRFGTQDAMGMGIKMEKKFERLATPAKFKMAVSGCPRNCAEATIKDFGVVAIDGGWELHISGNGGTKLRGSDLLTKVKTEDEVMEWCGAFIQYYRETGKYNERTSEWLERIGLDTVKNALQKEEDRLALISRVEHSLSLTKDPWKEIIEQDELKRTFSPMSNEISVSAR